MTVPYGRSPTPPSLLAEDRFSLGGKEVILFSVVVLNGPILVYKGFRTVFEMA